MHILYQVTYIPHLGTDFPKYYVGSKYNYVGNYFGSVDSRCIFDYTDGMTLRDWWKSRKPSNFKFQILASFEDISPKELLQKEHELHLALDILTDDYFNRTTAIPTMYPGKGYKLGAKARKNFSIARKRHWDSEEGEARKERLRNPDEATRLLKSKLAKQRWQNPTPAMLNKTKPSRGVRWKDRLFLSSKQASEITGIPLSTIQWKVRTNKDDWSYI